MLLHVSARLTATARHTSSCSYRIPGLLCFFHLCCPVCLPLPLLCAPHSIPTTATHPYIHIALFLKLYRACVAGFVLVRGGCLCGSLPPSIIIIAHLFLVHLALWHAPRKAAQSPLCGLACMEREEGITF